MSLASTLIGPSLIRPTPRPSAGQHGVSDRCRYTRRSLGRRQSVFVAPPPVARRSPLNLFSDGFVDHFSPRVYSEAVCELAYRVLQAWRSHRKLDARVPELKCPRVDGRSASHMLGRWLFSYCFVTFCL